MSTARFNLLGERLRPGMPIWAWAGRCSSLYPEYPAHGGLLRLGLCRDSAPMAVPVCGPVASNPYFNAQPAAVRTHADRQLVAQTACPTTSSATMWSRTRLPTTTCNSASNVLKRASAIHLLAGLQRRPADACPPAMSAWPSALTGAATPSRPSTAPTVPRRAPMNQNYSTYSGGILGP